MSEKRTIAEWLRIATIEEWAEMSDIEVAVLVKDPPAPNNSTPIWDLVIADMKARDNLGRQRYRTPLQANNGRDALKDAYEEALDLAVYLRQAIEERATAPQS